jgi:hypothetical protein
MREWKLVSANPGTRTDGIEELFDLRRPWPAQVAFVRCLLWPWCRTP